MLYLASDKIIAKTLWSKSNPNVCVTEPRTIPKHFSKKYIYYINSTECCGCGFRQENDAFYPDFSEIESKNKNQLQLYETLYELLNGENYVELFGCWAGGEDDLEEKREIAVGELLKDEFYFMENELITVKK
jgi:hypothetical protein